MSDRRGQASLSFRLPRSAPSRGPPARRDPSTPARRGGDPAPPPLSVRTFGERRPKVLQQARGARLAVVRVDLQRAVHPDREALLGGVQRLARRVGPRVAHDEQAPAVLASSPAAVPAPPERVDGVRDQHHVLVPAHQLALARRAADEEPVDAAAELRRDERVVGV